MRCTRERISRRAALQAIALAACGTASACGTRTNRATPSAGTAQPQTPVINVSDETLYRVRGSVVEAWQASGGRPTLSLQPWAFTQPQAAIEGDHDVFTIFGDRPATWHVLDLTKSLRASNVDLSSLVPGALSMFADQHGIRALPFALSEWQFYVNAPALQALGLTPPATWTLDEVIAALAAASQKPRAIAPMIGVGWGNVSLWGAMVLGMGGALDTQAGAVDLAGAVAPTKEMLGWPRLGWNPTGKFWLPPFSGPRAQDGLFGFYGAWTVDGTTALQGVPISPFPTLRARALVPSYLNTALGISARSQRPDEAASFLLWLYQPAQQQLLAAQGIPPVVTDPAVVAFWQQQQQQRKPSTPIFLMDEYVDVFARLPPGISSDRYQTLFNGAFDRMVAGADVAAELHNLQNAINALARSAASA